MAVPSADSKCSHATVYAALSLLSRHSYLSEGGSADALLSTFFNQTRTQLMGGAMETGPKF